MSSSGSKKERINFDIDDLRRKLWIRKLGFDAAVEQLGFETEDQKEDLRRMLQKIAAEEEAKRAAAPENQRPKNNNTDDDNDDEK
ncbi:hypothetical protein TWF506_005488 [Arthrobotrys conoides]|uniref:Uncharacterized protein n=1 Tax=Arthrobotrys conoides TaxID=74498 RepID=A0AAN8NEA0_9PEZI